MVKWSELKRASDVVLAVWPHYRPLFERWLMQEFIDKGELAPVWRERMVPGENERLYRSLSWSRSCHRGRQCTQSELASGTLRACHGSRCQTIARTQD